MKSKGVVSNLPIYYLLISDFDLLKSNFSANFDASTPAAIC